MQREQDTPSPPHPAPRQPPRLSQRWLANTQSPCAAGAPPLHRFVAPPPHTRLFSDPGGTCGALYPSLYVRAASKSWIRRTVWCRDVCGAKWTSEVRAAGPTQAARMVSHVQSARLRSKTRMFIAVE